MGIEVYQVKGDVMELIFDPTEEDLRVGETLCVRERDSGNGLIVQVISFRSLNYPSLVRDLLRLALNGERGNGNGSNTGESIQGGELPPEFIEALSEQTMPRERNLKVAICKIRKLANGEWDQWDGWIPHRDVEVTRTADSELFENCIELLGNPIELGYTLRGEPFKVDGRHLEKINIITGVKGCGKSHLAKVILLELMQLGAPCIVFDINREYVHLPKLEVDAITGRVIRPGIVHLKAGVNLKFGLRQFGIQPLITMLTKFGLPEVSAMHLENRLFGLFEEMRAMEQQGRKSPFLTIEHLIQMAEHNELAESEIVNTAIRSRLEAVRNTRVFARTPSEAIDLKGEYNRIRYGGALIIDISDLTPLARFGFVQAVIEIIKEICERELSKSTNRFPFAFFEEAHLYVTRNTIGTIVTRSRHIGITCFFITNMIGSLDETVLRQADNLFIMNTPFEDDVRHLAKCALTDLETMSSFVKRLRRHHALVIGNATKQYPVIIRVKPLEGINTAGETQYFFQAHRANGAQAIGRRSPQEMMRKLFGQTQ
ncbi:MAG: ATP-binding protein [Armatimonadota bacterium]|nr:ATP-binding protein [Armatimonadota bacterium]MDW8025309.1 ATP-binding protein [Armatimonadota bacterium]